MGVGMRLKFDLQAARATPTAKAFFSRCSPRARSRSGGTRPGWHTHVTDSDANQLAIAVEKMAITSALRGVMTRSCRRAVRLSSCDSDPD